MTTSRHNRPAFTLLELMISIALALLLILGVNQVFSLTARTVGAGQSLTAAYQGSRAGGAVISFDFRQAVPMSTAPCFVIESGTRYSWRNRNAFNTDSDKDPSTLDPNNVTVPPNAIIPGGQSHRIDRVGFFARGIFTTQTGSGSAFIDTVAQNGVAIPVTSNEAWIVYGHLAVPNNSVGGNLATNSNTFPGAGATPYPPSSNPNNFYAAQWVLGRRVVLLIPKQQPSPANPQGAYPVAGYYDPTRSSNLPLAPLDYQSKGTDGRTLDISRNDVAMTSISDFTQQITAFVGTSTQADYWSPLVASPNFRFIGNPLPIKASGTASGINPESAAQVAPCFLAGCSQFAVEYTGDFISQQNDPTKPDYGKVLGAGPDGVPDYQVLPNLAQQIRWYGMPRLINDFAGDGTIDPSKDVVPLGSIVGQQLFERVMPHFTTRTYYGSVQAGDRYVVAWGPDTQSPPAVNGQAPPPLPTPTMLRFTVTLDDMSNRTGGGQTFEYVVPLQQ